MTLPLLTGRCPDFALRRRRGSAGLAAVDPLAAARVAARPGRDDRRRARRRCHDRPRRAPRGCRRAHRARRLVVSAGPRHARPPATCSPRAPTTCTVAFELRIPYLQVSPDGPLALPFRAEQRLVLDAPHVPAGVTHGEGCRARRRRLHAAGGVGAQRERVQLDAGVHRGRPHRGRHRGRHRRTGSSRSRSRRSRASCGARSRVGAKRMPPPSAPDCARRAAR